MDDQLTFKEQEVKELIEFLNFIIERAKFDVSPKDMFKFAELYKKAIAHIKKCEGYIMELKDVKEKPKKDKK